MAAFTESARDIRALVFDCDGTVLDTMEFYWPTWQATCGKHGIPVTKRRFYELAGVPVKGIYETLVADAVAADPNAACKGITSADIDAILAEKKAMVAERRKTVAVGVIPEVVAIVKANHGKLPMAIASSGHRTHVVHGLKEHGLFDLFDAVVCNEDNLAAGGRPKPAPDTFLLAAKQLGIAPEHCRGYEDADLGMQALRAAGMEAVDVRLLPGHPAHWTTKPAPLDGLEGGEGGGGGAPTKPKSPRTPSASPARKEEDRSQTEFNDAAFWKVAPPALSAAELAQ